MGEHLVPVLLITANVGSVFENVSNLNNSYVFFLQSYAKYDTVMLLRGLNTYVSCLKFYRFQARVIYR